MELILTLPELRKARNITIEDMAVKMNISRNGYRNKESGKQPIALEEKILICEILDVPLKYLFPEDAIIVKKSLRD